MYQNCITARESYRRMQRYKIFEIETIFLNYDYNINYILHISILLHRNFVLKSHHYKLYIYTAKTSLLKKIQPRKIFINMY